MRKKGALVFISQPRDFQWLHPVLGGGRRIVRFLLFPFSLQQYSTSILSVSLTELSQKIQPSERIIPHTKVSNKVYEPQA